MSKIDAESVLEMIYEIMTEGDALAAAITAVEAEKTADGKGLTPALEPIKGFFEQTWTAKMLNKSPAIFYGIEDIQAESIGPATKKTYQCFVQVCVLDNGQRNDVYKRVHRYTRALEELFERKFAPALGAKVLIAQIRPMAFKLEEDSDDELKVGGISVIVSIA